MGWDAAFTIFFREQEDPTKRFKDLALEMFTSGVYHHCNRIIVYEGTVKTRVFALEDETDPLKPLTFEQMEDAAQQYSGPLLAVSSSWACSRDTASPPDCIPDIENDTSTLTIFGTQFYIHPWSKHRAHAVMETSDFRKFASHYCVERSRRNIQFALDELALFVEYGAMTLRGLDADRSLDPCEHNLCYHSEPDMYSEDLRTIFPEIENIRPVTREDLRIAADRCEGIVLYDDLEQPIIYHENFTLGDLSSFYALLAGIVKERRKSKRQPV